MNAEYEKKVSEYRNILIAAEQKSQDDYDKTLVSLSGGALGISFLFIEHVIGKSEPVSSSLLISAWACWAISLAATVSSYFCSCLAIRKTIVQCDANDYSGGIGGKAAKATAYLNAASGIFFIIGVVLIIVFCSKNIGGKEMEDNQGSSVGTKGYTPPPPPPPTPTSAPSRDPLTEGVLPPPPPPPPPSSGDGN